MNTTTIPKEIQAPKQQVPTSQVISKILDSIDLQKVRASQSAESPHLQTRSARQRKPQAYTLD